MLITLPLYILRELVKSLLSPLVIYSFCVLPFILAGMMRQSVAVTTIISITPLVFPYIAGYILPPAIMTGTVLCYGRLNNDNEYSAMLAGGIWPGWAVVPSLAVGLIATFFTLYLNESVLTYSTQKISETLIEGQVSHIKRQLSRQGVVQVGDNHLYRFPTDEKGRQALDVTIYKEPKDSGNDSGLEGKNKYGNVEKRIVALDHSIEVKRTVDERGRPNNTVMLNLKDCTMEIMTGKGSRLIESQNMIKTLQVEAKTDSPISNKRVACWGLGELSYQRERLKERLDKKEITQKDYNKSYKKYTRALHTRLALSFSCLLFSIAGTLLGLTLKHGDRSGRFVSGFGVAVVYFLVFLLCRAVADIGGWVLWIPNFALLGGSFYLWRKLF